MNCALILFLLFLSGCAVAPVKEIHPSGLNITEIKPNHDSHIMKQNVLHLAQVFDLSPFLYTKNIHIKTDAIPQSHPVLTLNNRYTNYPHKILSVLLHEEFHWWAIIRKQQLALAVKELKTLFPHQHASVYTHFLICHLEYEAVKFYVGEKVATSIIKDFIQKDKIRPWIYSQILVKNQMFSKLFLRYKLIPKRLL